MRKKILYYNWIQFDEIEKRGGGVTVYQKNLIDEFCKTNNYEIFFISSGVEYNFLKKRTYIKETKNIYGDKCHSYKIINSPIPAPGITIINSLNELEKNEVLKSIFRNFLKEKGPFDVIHFNNLEGISLDVLDLKQEFNEIKFIYSLHNYYFCCPKVTLWKENKENCINVEKKECGKCIQYNISLKKIKILGNLFYFCDKFNISNKYIFKLMELVKKIKNNKKYNKQQENFDYKFFKNIMIEKINHNIDKILAVSERVKEIGILNGINSLKTEVLYIGTKFAKVQLRKCISSKEREIFKIAYFGYMKKEKGFYFFIECLKKLEPKISKNIDVLLATKITDTSILDEIEKMKENYHSIVLKDGYTHEEIKKLMKDINLGIVPVLWEDNLPQVAIEFVANGVPILTSDLGGAKELGKTSEFIFKNNNIDNFNFKLINIFNNRKLLDVFFENQIDLESLESHIKKLEKIYF